MVVGGCRMVVGRGHQVRQAARGERCLGEGPSCTRTSVIYIKLCPAAGQFMLNLICAMLAFEKYSKHYSEARNTAL